MERREIIKKFPFLTFHFNLILYVLFFQFDAEFRRWSIQRSDIRTFEDFYKQVETLHRMKNLQFLISYIDPKDNDLLPINNDDNFGRAVSTAKPILRVHIQRKGTKYYLFIIALKFYLKITCFSYNFFFFYLHSIKGDSLEEITGYGTIKPRNIISSILGQTPVKSKSLAISNPHDFRQVSLFNQLLYLTKKKSFYFVVFKVSAIIDVDIVPETCRRVRLLKHGSDKPLGFYIR